MATFNHTSSHSELPLNELPPDLTDSDNDFIFNPISWLQAHHQQFLPTKCPEKGLEWWCYSNVGNPEKAAKMKDAKPSFELALTYVLSVETKAKFQRLS